MNIPKLLFSLSVLIATPLANAANVQVYYDQTEWANAVAAAGRTVVTEDFNDPTLNCALTTVTQNGHVDVGAGNWSDILTSNWRGNQKTTFKFSSKVFAIGGYWGIDTGGSVNEFWIDVSEDSMTRGVYSFTLPMEGFVGLISEEPINELNINYQYNITPPRPGPRPWGRSLSYTLDNLQYAEAGTVSIQNSECGVANSVIPNSNPVCTVQDAVGFAVSNCADGAKNHGRFVSCFTKNVNALKKEGALTDGDKGALTSCAAKAQIPEK